MIKKPQKEPKEDEQSIEDHYLDQRKERMEQCEKKENYIVELENSVWIACWTGDPGRTVVKEHARVFCSKKDARRALRLAILYRPFKNAKILRI